jgi:hypothetical protein
MRKFTLPRFLFLIGIGVLLLAGWNWLAPRFDAAQKSGLAPLIRSKQDGPWSAAATWDGGKVPGAGARVQIRAGHRVVYDVANDQVIRFIHVAGTLAFADDKSTRLDVGLIKIQPGDDATEDGFDCDGHAPDIKPGAVRPALEVGTPLRPIDAKHTALIRLHYVAGMDKLSCPAIVCCGGRMDVHGAAMNRTWVKLGATAQKLASTVTLDELVPGWRVGDRVILTATKLKYGELTTEERTIGALTDKQLTLDKPLVHEHNGSGEFRGEVANLSRNVIVESADPAGIRGHTMYHMGSQGAISYAEFRHLGKKDVLGRYAIHYHLAGNSMRGSYVIGASVWDSHNRWITIHGTNYLVVRDCVGYQSIGHGFFLEDGTEVHNVLDRNLAVQARRGKKLPKQILSFDQNQGAGFWWANSLNTFTRNVSCENERYGYRFEATKTSASKLTLPVLQPDGTRKVIDVRTLPFVRFQGNEAHCDGLYGINLGEGVARVGPDAKHPFILRDTKIWEIHYAFRPQAPSVLVENMRIHRAAYGVYHPNYDNHVYKNLSISETNTEPFNRGHDDLSEQHGVLAVDGLTFEKCRSGGSMPLIQISDTNANGSAESHFRNVKLVDWSGAKNRAMVNLGGGPRPQPKSDKGVPIYVHDWYGQGKHAKVVSTKASELQQDGLKYKEDPNLTGDQSRAAEIDKVSFPKLLEPIDDLPPATVITHIGKLANGTVTIRGTTSDSGAVAKVLVNGQPARATAANFEQWEVILRDQTPGQRSFQAHAEDAAGNVERTPHVVAVEVKK